VLRGKVASGSGCEGSLWGREASCNCCLVAVEGRGSLCEDDTSLEREWFASWAAEWLLRALGAPWGRGWRLAAWESALFADDQRYREVKPLKAEKEEKLEEKLEEKKVKELKEQRLLAVDQRGAEAV